MPEESVARSIQVLGLALSTTVFIARKRSRASMAFDPVRDAILNSPERLTYDDPFAEPGVGESEGGDSFKAPTTGRTGSLRASDSPERPSSASNSHLADLAQTPGGDYSFPPTPGGSFGSSSYGQPALTPGTACTAQRQSSIFSLLSPDPPAETTHNSQQSYFDSLRETNFSEQGERADATESLVDPPPAASTSKTVSKLKPSLAVETAVLPAPASIEPIKRGRPYAPVRRINGPAPQSLYIPLTAEERAYYLDPANCKNPLRTGVSVAARPPPVDGYNRKGKGRAVDEPDLPDEIDIAPRYREPSPLHPSLEPGLIQQSKGNRPALTRNGSSGSPSKKRKRISVSDTRTLSEYTAVAAHCEGRTLFFSYSPLISSMQTISGRTSAEKSEPILLSLA
jgi:hypothetical protein